MNSYPFEALNGPRMNGPRILPPPPPPPPLPSSSAPGVIQRVPPPGVIPGPYGQAPPMYNQYVPRQGVPTHQSRVEPMQFQARTPMYHVPSPQVNIQNNHYDARMMLATNQLRLPPPPPPPLPSHGHIYSFNSQNEFDSINLNRPAQTQHGELNHDKCFPRLRPFNTGGPPPWKQPHIPGVNQVDPMLPVSISEKPTEQQTISTDPSAIATKKTTLCPSKPKKFLTAPAKIKDKKVDSKELEKVDTTEPGKVDSKEPGKVEYKEPLYPKELLSLFEALSCKLCEVVSGSPIQAQLHYTGKPHAKKVRQWLNNWSIETGQPMPKREKLEPIDEINPEDLYCKLCDITFTSIKHGEQHKMGKSHRKALRLGYNNSKKVKRKEDPPADPTGRYGTGGSCLPNIDNNSPVKISQTPSGPSTIPKPTPYSRFSCKLCNVSATSQEHLTSHLMGAKHRKALVIAARVKAMESQSQSVMLVPAPTPNDSILESVMRQTDSPSQKGLSNVLMDFSIYRTPSGQYYCHNCDITVNSERTFKEHIESKKHKQKIACRR